MTELRHILAPVASAFSLARMIRRTGKMLIFPFYHTVSDDPPPYIRHLYRVKSTDEFRRDLDELLKYFEPASPGLLTEPDTTGRPDKPAFILSFDDGLREVSDIIVPLLEKKGINAVFFLNNHFIGNKDLFFRYKVSLLIDKIRRTDLSPAIRKEVESKLELSVSGDEALVTRLLSLSFDSISLIDRLAGILEVDFITCLSKNRPYLNETEIRKLVEKGFYIGGHSMDHPSFHEMDASSQYEEIVNSVSDLKTRFGVDYSLFSFPFSDTGVGEEVFRRLYNPLHRELDASFGTSGLKRDEPFPHFQRIPLEKSAADAETYLKAEYFYYILKSFTGHNNVRRQGWR